MRAARALRTSSTSASAAATSAPRWRRRRSPPSTRACCAAFRVERRRHAIRGHAACTRSRAHAGDRLLEDLHDPGDARECAPRPRLARRESSARRRCRGTLPRCPPMTRRWTHSASAPTRASRCGTGSAAATRSGRPSGLSVELAIGTAHFEAHARGRACDGRAFPQRTRCRQPARAARPDRALEPQRAGLREPCRTAVQQRLARLPAYLQQLEMESLGKRVTRDGRPLPHPPAPSSGANRDRTPSIRSSSCCTRAPPKSARTSCCRSRPRPMPRPPTSSRSRTVSHRSRR